jgi:hypothetical protein
MLNPTLSTLAVVLGIVVALPNVFGVFRPGEFAAAARKFPRCTPVGYILTLAATAWFLYYLSLESMPDFTSFKPALYALFAGVGIGTCLFVRDYLPVRGLAALMLLAGKLMVDTGRPHLGETAWVLVIQSWAYVLVVSGMWFTISPWRLRDLINWSTADVRRTRFLSGIRLGFALLVVVLGLTVFRGGEGKNVASSGSGSARADKHLLSSS